MQDSDKQLIDLTSLSRSADIKNWKGEMIGCKVVDFDQSVGVRVQVFFFFFFSFDLDLLSLVYLNSVIIT